MEMGYIGSLGKDKEIIEGNKNILIYGTGGYGEKIYRSLIYYNIEKQVTAFIDKSVQGKSNFMHGIPVISIGDAVRNYADFVVCIGGEALGKVKQLDLIQGMKNIHQIIFSTDCIRYGTEYGGFYIPEDYIKEGSIVYSFGIGEDLSFSEAVINAGGIVYAFDPTPKAVKYTKNHRLFTHSNFHFFPYGLSDTDGDECMYLPIRNDWVSASVIQHESVDDKNCIKVNMRTIRTIMNQFGHKQIDVLKMDIEGSEFKVVKDLMDPNLEAINVKLVCMETHERFFESKKCIDDLYELMRNRGFYDIYGLPEEPTFIKI